MTTTKNKILKGIFHRDQVVRLRERSGWSQRDLALRLGLSFVTVWNWETGGSIPKRNHLKKLASVFQVSISTFYTEAKDLR